MVAKYVAGLTMNQMGKPQAQGMPMPTTRDAAMRGLLRG